MTFSEVLLWNQLKRKQMRGYDFDRQRPIDNYIVDFYCPSEKLIIELDGAYHLDFAQQNYDYERTQVLEKLGFKVIRFENKLVFENLTYVLEEIMNHFKK